MTGAARLAATLERIDGKGYKAYRDIEGEWPFSEFTLAVDRVQADPFAAPSKLRVRVDAEVAHLPARARGNPVRERALRAWLARAFHRAIQRARPRRIGTGKGGLIGIDAGGPEVLDRTACILGPDFLEVRIEVGLPAAGRRALGREASDLLTQTLPELAVDALIDRSEADDCDMLHFIDCVENQEAVRARLVDRGLIAFVGNGAILPRESGASEQPMAEAQVARFESPDAFAVEFDVPNPDAGASGQTWRGMGIPTGITLLVGGGYHGKSTLLRAIERGVVPHVPGDGRETVVADAGLVKIRAEDGRAVTKVDIQNFIDRLPTRPGESQPRSTRAFSTLDASGSTSQAANIAEALEVGASGLLIDEDTAATNFMVRDRRMQQLIHPKDEPITPFVDRVRALYDELGVSTILVMGGSGDYLGLADRVIEMKSYEPLDATERARAIASDEDGRRNSEGLTPLRAPDARVIEASGFDARRGRRDVKFSSRDCEEIVYGTTEIDLRGVEQLFDPSQTRAIAGALHVIATRLADGERTLSRLLDEFDAFVEREGLDALDPFHRAGQHPGALARPRRFEIAAAINRMRTLSVGSR